MCGQEIYVLVYDTEFSMQGFIHLFILTKKKLSACVFLFQSLKSRGIRFPGRDNESLAPIFTPPRSVSDSEYNTDFPQQIQRDFPVQSFTAEQTKEAFDVARNCIELLTTVLSSSPQQDALKVILSSCDGCLYLLIWVSLLVNI
jgi:hypothetical protein